jgi:hypothetical protein
MIEIAENAVAFGNPCLGKLATDRVEARMSEKRGKARTRMTKASDDLQDLRRRIYFKAKAEPSWRFWVYTYVCPGAIGLRLGTME